MNCEEGDIAIVRFSAAGHEGKIVKCIQFYGNVAAHSLSSGKTIPAPAWVIVPPLVTRSGDPTNILTDAQLSPLRNAPGMDEMLIAAGLPPKGNVK